jgi:hypothetical protein
MSAHETSEKTFEPETYRLARMVLVSFVFIFIAARVSTYLIMSRRIPDLYVHLGGTHIHHFNYGIFLLAAVAGYLLFKRPKGRGLSAAAIIYGIGLGLTFDEFGMWLHLGGDYWQRASFDVVIVICGSIGVIAFAPTLKQFRPRHWISGVALALAVVLFGILLVDSFKYAARHIGPRLHRIETTAPK